MKIIKGYYNLWGYNYEWNLEAKTSLISYSIYSVDDDSYSESSTLAALNSETFTLPGEGRYAITIYYPDGSGTTSATYRIMCFPELKEDIITTMRNVICGCTSLGSSLCSADVCTKSTNTVVAQDLNDMEMLYNSVGLYRDILLSPEFLRNYQCSHMTVLFENFYTLHKLLDTLYDGVNRDGVTPNSARLVKLYTAYMYVLFYIMEIDQASCEDDAGGSGTGTGSGSGAGDSIILGGDCDDALTWVVNTFDYETVKYCFINLGLDFDVIYNDLRTLYLEKSIGLCDTVPAPTPPPSVATIDNLTYQSWEQYVEIGDVITPLVFSWEVTGTPENLLLNDKGFGTIVDQVVTGTNYNSGATTYALATKGSIQWELKGDNVSTITLQTNWMYPAYWDKKKTSDFPDAIEIEAGNALLGDFSTEIEFQPDTAIDDYAWIAVAVDEAIQYTNWEVQTTVINSSVIGSESSSEFIIIKTTNVTVGTQPYRVYMFNYVSEISEVIRLFKP